MNVVIKDKNAIYGSFTTFKSKLIDISNRLMGEMGDSSQFNMTSPMLLAFTVLQFLSLFIDNLIYAILIILAILSYILISSLMVFNIDEKTYEFGMLRALGFKRQSLVYMLLIQGFIFSVSGWTLGIVTSFVMTTAIKYYFYMSLRIKIGVVMSLLAWISSIFFGFMTPIITNFFSISKSLGKNLKDSLDLYRRSVNELTIVFVKLNKLGIS
jgi:ABC-type antimicrobial peptide transport system permease subunit